MKRLPIVLAAGALVVALLGAVPLGQAASSGLRHKVSKGNRATSKPLRGPRGPRGLRGKRGPVGPPGPAGPAGGFNAANVVQANGQSVTMAPGAVGSSQAFCPAGSVPLGGGWDGESNPPVDATVGYNTRYSVSWGVIMVNWSSISATYHAFVVCGVPSAGSYSMSAHEASADQRAFTRDVSQFRAGVARMANG